MIQLPRTRTRRAWYVCMYVCMVHLSIYAYMYCTYVRMYGPSIYLCVHVLYVCTYVWSIYLSMYGPGMFCMYLFLYTCNVCMYACVSVCVYIYTYIYILIYIYIYTYRCDHLRLQTSSWRRQWTGSNVSANWVCQVCQCQYQLVELNSVSSSYMN